MKSSDMKKDDLMDLVGIIASLKNRYSIIPFAVTVQGELLPNALTARYLVDALSLSKLMELLRDTRRPARVLVVPRQFAKGTQFELNVTVGD
jgi:hypothetical protein